MKPPPRNPWITFAFFAAALAAAGLFGLVSLALLLFGHEFLAAAVSFVGTAVAGCILLVEILLRPPRRR